MLLPLPEAADRLGISVSALRRRLHAGAAQGEKRPTASGFAWWVQMPDADPSAPRPTPTPTPTPTGGPPPTPPPTPTRAPETPGATTLPVQAARAAEMALYSQQLLAPVLARLEAQAEELGRVRTELDHARARIAELETPLHKDAPPVIDQAGRPWWRLLFGLA